MCRLGPEPTCTFLWFACSLLEGLPNSDIPNRCMDVLDFLAIDRQVGWFRAAPPCLSFPLTSMFIAPTFACPSEPHLDRTRMRSYRVKTNPSISCLRTLLPAQVMRLVSLLGLSSMHPEPVYDEPQDWEEAVSAEVLCETLTISDTGAVSPDGARQCPSK